VFQVAQNLRQGCRATLGRSTSRRSHLRQTLDFTCIGHADHLLSQ